MDKVVYCNCCKPLPNITNMLSVLDWLIRNFGENSYKFGEQLKLQNDTSIRFLIREGELIGIAESNFTYAMSFLFCLHYRGWNVPTVCIFENMFWWHLCTSIT